MVKKYIDFDNVILDTRDSLFCDYDKLIEKGFDIDKIRYI